MTNQALIKQIQYKFRRGLRETDILFEKFQANHFNSLTENELEELNQILEKTDQDMLALYIEKQCKNPTELEKKIMNYL
ncbi:MAG: hypothetical protein CFH44_00495 [Proteobacteria bacterium]|nr:MAG: hypothetical protein CFH44_00495 [Pseudomonadota bacterium]